MIKENIINKFFGSKFIFFITLILLMNLIIVIIQQLFASSEESFLFFQKISYFLGVLAAVLVIVSLPFEIIRKKKMTKNQDLENMKVKLSALRRELSLQKKK